MIHTNEIATREADAQTILEQIGRPALWAIGAKNIVNLGDGIHFNISPSRKIVVKLAANDTYAVETVRMNRRDYSLTSEYFAEMVYADQLQDVVLLAAGSDL